MSEFITYLYVFSCHGDHRDLHVLAHSFPTRRSSELPARDHEGIALAPGEPLRRVTVANHGMASALDHAEHGGIRRAVGRTLEALGQQLHEGDRKSVV